MAITLRVTALLAALMPIGVPALADPQGFSLRFIDRTKVYNRDAGLTEASGVTLSAAGDRLWVVSDDTKKVFGLSLDGDIDTSFDLNSSDLEGIAVGEGVFVTVAENGNLVQLIDSATRELQISARITDLPIDAELKAKLSTIDKENGLEGVTIDRATGMVFVAVETDPRLLLRLTPDLDRITNYWELTSDAGFRIKGLSDAELDISGLEHDPRDGHLWIVSDRGKSVFRFDPRLGNASSAPLIFQKDGESKRVKNAEGIAFDPARGRIYIVTDQGKKSRLYTFQVE
ncbi:MAG: SdiA-regulated domain-containing protein [Paracoccaceae bacterium]|nr:SdiA-regulated domain-containing protein [Paracoccaceae bacterium]